MMEMLDPGEFAAMFKYHVMLIADFHQPAVQEFCDTYAVGFENRLLGGPKSEEGVPRPVTEDKPFLGDGQCVM